MSGPGPDTSRVRIRKTARFAYNVANLLSLAVPRRFWEARRERLLAEIARRPDRDEIEARAAYCCKLDPASPAPLPPDAPALGAQRMPKRGRVYFFDTRAALRYFPPDLRWLHEPGDVTRVPPAPTIVKSRPVAGDNANGVLLQLNRIRHFVFVDGDVPFEAKEPTAVFRGKVCEKGKRVALFERWFGAPGVDLGDTTPHPARPEWSTPFMPIRGQLRHRFVLCIEGNDVSSNLKWVMSSNSLAVMPRPEYETWFREGLLRPGVHYVEIRRDFADLREKTDWYAAHPDACREILRNAHEWTARFRDPVREKLVSLLVLDRYFRATGQFPAPARPRPDFALAREGDFG